MRIKVDMAIESPKDLKPYVEFDNEEALDKLFMRYENSDVDADELREWRVLSLEKFLWNRVLSADAVDMRDTLRDILEWCSSYGEVMNEMLEHIGGECGYDYFILDHHGKESLESGIEILYKVC